MDGFGANYRNCDIHDLFIEVNLCFVGFKVEPKQRPHYSHYVVKGAHSTSGRQSKQRIDSTLSAFRVCSNEALSIQRKLQNEYFSQWNEECTVKEYKGFGFSQTEELIHKISNDFAIDKNGMYEKLLGIKFMGELDVNIFDIIYEDKFNSGSFYFGLVAVSNVNNILNAHFCGYKLNIKKAKKLVTETTTTKFLGIRIWTSTENWSETSSLEVGTRKDLENFCRYKALLEFKKRKLVSRIHDVSSLGYI